MPLTAFLDFKDFKKYEAVSEGAELRLAAHNLSKLEG